MRNLNKSSFLIILFVLAAALTIAFGVAWAAGGPELSIPTGIPAQANSTVKIPVIFTDNGDPDPNDIVSLAFSVDYDEAWLAFDPNVTNAVDFGLPSTYAGNCDFDETDTDGELDCSVFGFGSEIPALADGQFLTITLNTLTATRGTIAPVEFSVDPPVSFGNSMGQSIAGTTQDGWVQFGAGAYLPVLFKQEPPPVNTPTPTNTGTAPTDTPTPTPTGTLPTNTPTPTSTGTAPTDTPTLTATSTETQPTCQNIIVDWSFEEQDDAWILEVTEYQAQYSNQRSNSGDWSVLTGIQDSGDNVYSYSSVSQWVTIPNNIDSATLTFWHYSQSEETVQYNWPFFLKKYIFNLKPELYDWQYAIAIDPNDPDNLTWLYSSTNDNTRDWVEETIDMADFEGETFILRFSTRNDGYGGVSAMFVDDITLEVCK